MRKMWITTLLVLGLVGSSHGAAHPAPDPSVLGDNMQSFTEDPYMTDEKFREKGKQSKVSMGVSICLDMVSIESLDLDSFNKDISTFEKLSTASKSRSLL
jgi:hypothetical protein